MDDLIALVSEATGVPPDVMKDPSVRTERAASARHVAMYLAARSTFLSRRAIAKYMGQSDHSSVNYALRKVAQNMKRNQGFKAQVRAMEDRVA